jgi:hypothetical protein
MTKDGQTVRPLPFGPYWVTSDGRVWSEARRHRWLSGYMSGGYLRFQLGRGRQYFAHVLVMHAWGPTQPNGKPMVRHLNGDPLDNRIGNLAWGDYTDNLDDGWRLGEGGIGAGRWCAIFTAEDARSIWCAYQAGAKVSEIARRRGVSYSSIWDICHGRTWARATKDPNPSK